MEGAVDWEKRACGVLKEALAFLESSPPRSIVLGSIWKHCHALGERRVRKIVDFLDTALICVSGIEPGGYVEAVFRDEWVWVSDPVPT